MKQKTQHQTNRAPRKPDEGVQKDFTFGFEALEQQKKARNQAMEIEVTQERQPVMKAK